MAAAAKFCVKCGGTNHGIGVDCNSTSAETDVDMVFSPNYKGCNNNHVLPSFGRSSTATIPQATVGDGGGDGDSNADLALMMLRMLAKSGPRQEPQCSSCRKNATAKCQGRPRPSLFRNSTTKICNNCMCEQCAVNFHHSESRLEANGRSTRSGSRIYCQSCAREAQYYDNVRIEQANEQNSCSWYMFIPCLGLICNIIEKEGLRNRHDEFWNNPIVYPPVALTAEEEGALRKAAKNKRLCCIVVLVIIVLIVLSISLPIELGCAPGYRRYRNNCIKKDNLFDDDDLFD